MKFTHLVKICLAIVPLLFISVASIAQSSTVSVSGRTIDGADNTALPFVNVIIKNAKDSSFVGGTATKEDGLFTITDIKPGNYFLQVSFVGYQTKMQDLYVGTLSNYLDAGTIKLERKNSQLKKVSIVAEQITIDGNMDKKTYKTADDISMQGGSVLQSMTNLPGVSVQDGKLQLRGNDKVSVLIDGKQTALTGFGNSAALENIPASAIEKIEIINNPSAAYDANGNAGIINIIYKKTKQEGFNGKVSLSGGLGALWVRKQNLPNMQKQYQNTPKLNPSLLLNYRKGNWKIYSQSDLLYTQTLNKSDFVTRTYNDGTIIQQQTVRNRNTTFFTQKLGADYNIDDHNMISLSGLFGTEKILDHGDELFFNNELTAQKQRWNFLEDELKTTAMGSLAYQHKFKELGRTLSAGVNYTFHREDEKYYFNNILPAYASTDSFKLISDEKVLDINVDYVQPLKHGRLETGVKFRNRMIPTNMQFQPGQYSILDTNAGGWATYKEIIPAVYGNYVYENQKYEAEIGLRVEYVGLQYDVNPNHNTYKSNGYNYTQPFPNMRLAYKLNDNNKISLFYNRRVDRPNEVDIRIFPKYDDVAIVKVGNPALRPQFTNSVELGYKKDWSKGYLYAALYNRFANATITRISSSIPGDPTVYAIFQNAGKSYNAGIEIVLAHKVNDWYKFSFNANPYYNQIDAFTVQNLYPTPNTFSAVQQSIYTYSAKMGNTFSLPNKLEAQLSMQYYAPDIIPQGKIAQRFAVNAGLKKSIQNDKGELFLNATDLFNTMITKTTVQGSDFHYTSANYNETQLVRLGYSYKF